MEGTFWEECLCWLFKLLFMNTWLYSRANVKRWESRVWFDNIKYFIHYSFPGYSWGRFSSVYISLFADICVYNGMHLGINVPNWYFSIYSVSGHVSKLLMVDEMVRMWSHQILFSVRGVKLYDRLPLVWGDQDYLSIYYFHFKTMLVWIHLILPS